MASGSPFMAKATIVSGSSAFAMGIDTLKCAPPSLGWQVSAPVKATCNASPVSAPAASSTAESGVPVQSAQPMAPAAQGSPLTGRTARMSARRLPAHCITARTVRDGRARTSASDSDSGRDTRPSTATRWVAPSSSGRSPCERT